MRLINVFVFFTLGLGLFAQNDNNANGPTGQITSAEMRIKGLVGNDICNKHRKCFEKNTAGCRRKKS